MGLIAVQQHAAFQAYLARERIETGGQRPDGSVVVLLPGRLRMVFHPTAGGDIVLESRVLDLTDFRPVDVDRICKKVLEEAGQRHWAQCGTVALADNGRALMLQQRLPARCSLSELDAALQDHLATLTTWRTVMERESA